MLKNLQRLAICIPIALCSHLASADVLNFDNLTGTGTVPASYGGFTFNNWSYSDTFDADFLAHSGATNVFTDVFGSSATDGNASITTNTPIIFDGAYFSGFSGVSFKLYNGGVLVHVSDALAGGGATSYAPTFLSSGYTGLVDKIVVNGVQGYYAMDDLTFHAAAVPEPTSAMLMLLGGVAVAAVKRRRAKSSQAF